MYAKPLHALMTAVAASLALLSGGCGPGVGGTGTGDSALVAFQAAAASVCDSAFADKLACVAALPGSPAPGTRAVRYVDADGQVLLQIDDNHASLAAVCLRLQFSGDFGVAPGTTAGFFGTYQLNASGANTFAALLVQRVDGGDGLRVELRDIDDRTVVAPVTLQIAPDVLPTPKSC